MNRTTDLDQALYEWLSEADYDRAKLKFNAYYKVAFPEICHFIRSFAPTRASDAEDIAQETFIKFAKYIGIERRSADMQFAAAMTNFLPLEFGEMHIRRVSAWLFNLKVFHDAVRGFRIGGERDPQWVARKGEINARIEPLRRQGSSFLKETETRLSDALTRLVETTSGSESAAPGSDGLFEPEITQFLTTLLDYCVGRTELEIAQALGYSNIPQFVAKTKTICCTLPALTLPNNGLLYTIAKNKARDMLRKWTPKTINGRNVLSYGILGQGNEEEYGSQSDLPASAPEAIEEAHIANDATSEAAQNHTELIGEADQSDAVAEDAEDRIVDTRYKAFMAFLRAQLTSAEQLLAYTSTRGRPTEALTSKIDRLQEKYDRLLTILDALCETPRPTEDQIAARLSLTRNQVKYDIKRLQDEFKRYFPDLSRDTEGRHRGRK